MTMAPEEHGAVTAGTAPGPSSAGWGGEPASPDGEGVPPAPRRWRQLRGRWKPAVAVLVVAAMAGGRRNVLRRK
jgi:hypothetical protein